MGGNAIQTASDFKQALTTLLRDLGRANDYYDISTKLYSAQEGGFAKAMALSQTFWTLTFEAHWEAAIFRLCRAYDQDPAALTLRTFLETINANASFLPATNPLAPLNPVQLAKDLEWVSLNSNPVVKHLIVWRHKVYAHRDRQSALALQGLGERFPISDEEIHQLLARGFEIMNRYNTVFYGVYFAREVLPLDDFTRSLQLIQADMEAQERRLQEQIRAHRQTD